MEQWEIDMNKAKELKVLKQKYPDLGKIVFYEGEYGVVILGSYCNDGSGDIEEVVRWDTNKKFDNEQYGIIDYKFIDSYEFKYINIDGTLKN